MHLNHVQVKWYLQTNIFGLFLSTAELEREAGFLTLNKNLALIKELLSLNISGTVKAAHLLLQATKNRQ